MPKATKAVKASLQSEPKPKESKAKRDTKNSNKDKEFKEKSKTEKDSDAPKRPLSAYMLYCADARDKVKEENPGAPVSKFEETCPLRTRIVSLFRSKSKLF